MYVMIINKRIEYVVVYNVLKRIKCAAFGSTPTPDFVRPPPLQNAASASESNDCTSASDTHYTLIDHFHVQGHRHSTRSLLWGF